MKYKLSEDHRVRLSNTVLKAGVYTLEELKKAHEHDSLDFCIKYTKLGAKLSPVTEESDSSTKKKK